MTKRQTSPMSMNSNKKEGLEMLEYLKTQFSRMNENQKALVNRAIEFEGKKELIPMERDRLATMYIWLHSSTGSIKERKFKFMRR